jgi:D-aspartate ligase
VRGRVLLASASAGGTIAAVRHLAENGFEVRLLASERLGAAAWSRWVTRSYRAPPESDEKRFLSLLLDIGRSDPGQILLPTSDKTSWLYARHASLLEKYYLLYQPPSQIFGRILDKTSLATAAAKAGIISLPIWDPETKDELSNLAPSLPYPILIKPRTHINRSANHKGFIANSALELIDRYVNYLDQEKTQANRRRNFSASARPFLQQFVQVGGEGVHSIAGFIDPSGELFATRRSRKVFQRSRPAGVGVCFEPLPPSVSLSQAVRALCQELGYFGMFEVEFLPFNGGWAVIDFNPRLYNQISLDIARGLPLPLFACLGALDEKTELQQAVTKAVSLDETHCSVFYDRFTLRAMLIAMYLTSRISRADLDYWRLWIKQNAAQAIDVATSSKDPMPGVIHALSETFLGLKSIRRFSRTTPRVTSGLGQRPMP